MSDDPDRHSGAIDEGRSLRRLAEGLAALHHSIGAEDGTSVLQRLVEQGASELVGARWSSVTILRSGKFRTIVATDEVARGIDEAQYQFGAGPCVDAVVQDSTFVTPDVSEEARWQPLGRRLRDEFGVRSMLAYRLHLLDGNGAIAGLNFSSDRPSAFTDADIHRGLVLASHCALVVTAEAAQTKAEHLLRGLESNREIGVAVGVLMARYRLTRQQAFDVLRVASQNTNRKLVDVATQVADTGLSPIDLRGQKGS